MKYLNTKNYLKLVFVKHHTNSRSYYLIVTGRAPDKTCQLFSGGELLEQLLALSKQTTICKSYVPAASKDIQSLHEYSVPPPTLSASPSPLKKRFIVGFAKTPQAPNALSSAEVF